MTASSEWDWEPGKREVHDTSQCSREVEWLEEPVASPDGESVACVANFGDGEFGVCVNGEPWESVYDRIFNLKYAPDGRLTGIASETGEWTLAVDDESWPESYQFLWDVKYSEAGPIAAAVNTGEGYGMSVDGEVWPTLFENANNFLLSPQGNASAAAVQVTPMGQADIDGFQKGIFSLAVNGQAWDRLFVNVWGSAFDPAGERVAAEVRINLYEYTIYVDGKPWPRTFGCTWQPLFHPKNGSVVAPVKVGGKWGLAKDGDIHWEPVFKQVWHQQYSADGKVLAAIVAPDFGRFTVAVDGKPWATTFHVVSDLAVSRDGGRIAAIGKEEIENWKAQKFQVMVDGSVWGGQYDMAWKPVLSGDGRNVAVKVEQGGKQTVALNGRTYKGNFSRVWDPVFNEDGNKVLIRAVEDGTYVRIVATVDEFTA